MAEVKQNPKKDKSILRLLLTSKFFWLVIIFLLIIGIVIKVAADMIEEARSTYSGLPDENGYPLSTITDEGFSLDENYFLVYEDDNYYSRHGIDVSEHQGYIDWDLVAEQGVEFAMIRLGYTGNDTGSKYLDACFEDNYKGAKKNGIDVGVYYFSQAISVEEAISEAQFVCENLKGKKINMPVVFDMEPIHENSKDRIANLTMKEITEITDAFCDIVEKHGYDALMYGNPSWIYKNLNLSLLTGRKLWLAHYVSYTQFPYEFVMWQYTDSGYISGIGTKVDLDIQFIKK